MINSYTTYVTTWGNDPLIQIQDMISKYVIKNNTIIVLAFASFNFSNIDYIPGFDITIEKVQEIIALVHLYKGKICLSIGGATYPFYGSELYSRPCDLANNINQVLTYCGFDGVDFDIEDYYINVPTDFVNNSASLINTLRNLNNELYITLTTPAQAWADGCYQQQLLNLTIGNINAWQPMEYDLWIESGLTYVEQINFDINYYINTWNVSPNKIILGLMPGNDDLNKNLSLQDSLNLTSFAQSIVLQGIMTWDIDNDSKGINGNAPYSYSLGIQSMLNINYKPKTNISLNLHTIYNSTRYKK
jgi:chitinase